MLVRLRHRDESTISSANPSIRAIWRDFKVRDHSFVAVFPCPHSPVPIPLSFSYWQGNGDKGMKNSEASGCITANYCIAMPMARFSANAEVAFERYIEDVSVRRFEV